MRNSRLLFVLNDAPFFVSHRLPLAVAAVRAGYDVHLAAPTDSSTEQLLAAAGISTHAIELDRSGSGLRREWRTFRSIAKTIRRLQPDIVHNVTIKPVLYASIARRLAGGGPTVNAVPGLGYVFLASGVRAYVRRTVVERLYRLALRGTRAVAVFQNPDDADLFAARRLVDRDAIELIRGSGVDLAQFAYAPELVGPPVVLLPARMLKDKGVFEFVDAARRLRHAHPTARFVLAGGVDLNRAGISLTQLEAWREEGVIEWVGQQSDMPTVLKLSTIVVLPSYREGVPKALLEAAATGRPIVTTDVPGCREVVTHGKQGLLVPPRDAAALATAIDQLLRSRDLRESMGRAARLRAEQEFGVDAVVHQTLAIYERLLRRS